jgi:PAS domain-containing protein
LSVQPKSAPVLSEAEQRLRTVVAKAPVVFFALDANGIFTLSEGRALEKLSLQPGQVIGQSVFELYRKYPAILASVRRALAGEEFSSSGALPDVDLFFETHWAPTRTPDGKLAGTIGIAVDVSERMRSAIQLGVEVADEDYDLYFALSQRIRLPNTERSKSQAG